MIVCLIQFKVQNRRIARFTDAYSNNYGLILDSQNCYMIRNGGCVRGNFKKFFLVYNSAPVYESVISLTSSSAGSWHFPMETLVALAHIPNELLRTSYIHIPYKSKYETVVIFCWYFRCQDY